MDTNSAEDGQLVFSLELTNPYVFRQIFDIYNKIYITSVPFYFKESGITIRTGTANKNNRKLISDVEIYTDEIIEYYLNPDICSVPKTDDQEACHIEQIDINILKSILKSISKSTNLRMYKWSHSDEVMIDIKGTTTEHAKICTSKYQSIDYDFSPFENISNIPNIKIETTQFCNGMKSMIRGDPEYISFKIFPKGIVVESRNSSETIMKDWKWGNIKSNYDDTDYVETKVNSPLVKALCKINGMLMYGIIKIISDEDGYLKISHKIADYGEHNIYFIDVS